MITPLETNEFLYHWPDVERHVAAACDHHPLQAPVMVLQALLDGKAQLVLVDEGCMVLEVQVYPNGLQVANIWLLAGDPGIWARNEAELEKFVDSWSKERGCDIIAMLGRPGWRKALGDQWMKVPLVQAWRKSNG